MKIHLSPQEKKVVEYLQSGEWKCMATSAFFIKDDRARITALNRKGYTIEGELCDSRANCGIQHSSKVFMRRLKDKLVVLKQSVSFKINPDGSRVAVIDLVPV